MKDKKNIKNWIKSTFIAVLIIIILAFLTLLFNYYVVDVVIVFGISMEPTLEEYQNVYISRYFMITGFNFERGDIINFEEPLENTYISNDNPLAIYDSKTTIGFLKHFNSETNYCIKRIIGLPGEHIEIKDGKIYINGEKLEEDYISSDIATISSNLSDFIVPENTVFVLGDNREHSGDSREFGCIPFERIDGVAY